MKILLYNHHHIGDTLFAQPIVKVLCHSNPKQEFMLSHLYNYHMYSTIPNLKIIDNMIEILQQPHIHNSKYAKIMNDIIVINTWIGGYHELVPVMECQPLRIFEIFANTIQQINKEFELNLIFDMSISALERLPSFPYYRLEIFDAWKERYQKKCIFYYNYYPRSGQHVPIESDDQHNTVIGVLSESFPDMFILVPKKTSMFADNVISCEEAFHIYNTTSCENVTQLAVIANSCEISVHYNIGACFYYLNQGSWFTNSIKIHINSKYCNYSNRLYQSIQEVEHKTDKKCMIQICPLECNNAMEVVQKLPEMIRTILPA